MACVEAAESGGDLRAAAEPAQQLGEMRADPQLQGVQPPHRRAEFPVPVQHRVGEADHARVRPGRLAQGVEALHQGGGGRVRLGLREQGQQRRGGARQAVMAVDQEMAGAIEGPPEIEDRRDVLRFRRDEALARTEAVVEPEGRAGVGAVGGEGRGLRRAGIEQRQDVAHAARAVAGQLLQAADGVQGDGGLGAHPGRLARARAGFEARRNCPGRPRLSRTGTHVLPATPDPARPGRT